MEKKSANWPVGVISAVVILCGVAAVFLIQNFSTVTVGQTWPGLLVAVGFCLSLAGFVGLGLSILGFFLLWLLSNLEVLLPFEKIWPLSLIWIAFLIVAGYVRKRSAREKTISKI